MQEVLAQMTPMLEGAIQDVSTGISSEFGYSAIFKDPVSIPYIKAVLQKMAAGSPMPVETKHWPGSRSPIFICVRPNDRDPAMAQFISKCPDPGTPAVLVPDSPWVVLCPSFFKMKVAPQSTDCPTMNLRGLMGSPNAIIANQYSALIRQLAHFYLGREDHQPEVTNLNEVFSISADVTTRNARSYEFYTASKISCFYSRTALGVLANLLFGRRRAGQVQFVARWAPP